MSITVFQLVNYLKNKLNEDANLHNFLIGGEISNYHRQFNSGHLYFTLKDERAQIACVMFKGNAAKLNFEPKNGDKVLLSASVSIYEGSGQLQLYVNAMKLDGLGDLYQKYEELKAKLTKEGYFNSDHKKSLPTKYPNRIAVLVGDKSAAMSDIKTCFERRWPMCNVDYYPCLVQGELAPKDIISKLLQVDELGYEEIILARGGGSFEDLFCFNDEELVKTIFGLKTFIITGVGHEQDFTLVDFVADMRAPTPTACVELLTPNIIDVKNDLKNLSSDLNCAMKELIDKKQMVLDYHVSRLTRFNEVIITYKNRINAYLTKINHQVSSKIKENLVSVNNRVIKMEYTVKDKFKERTLNVKRMTALLKAYSSENVINRGYSLTFKEGKIIKSVNDVKANDDIEIRVKDGIIKGLVK